MGQIPGVKVTAATKSLQVKTVYLKVGSQQGKLFRNKTSLGMCALISFIFLSYTNHVSRNWLNGQDYMLVIVF